MDNFDVNTLSLSQLVKLYNERSDKPVKAFKDKPTALRRVKELLDSQPDPTEDTEPTLAEQPTGTWDVPARGTKRAKGGKPGRPARYAADTRIVLLATGNPKRGASAARFALYSNAKTVGEYVAAGGLYGDIAWDVERGYIRLGE